MRNLKEMAEIAKRYHNEIQSNNCDPGAPPDGQEINEILGPIRTRLSIRSKQKLAETVSEDEVREAIRKTASDKACQGAVFMAAKIRSFSDFVFGNIHSFYFSP